MPVLSLRPPQACERQLLRTLAVRPEQQALVADFASSEADAAAHPDAELLGAWLGDVAVGYVMIFPYEQDGERRLNIVRLMLDQRFQGRGLGRALLLETLTWVRNLEPRPERLRISTLRENEVALKLYRSAGFAEAGLESGEVALYRALD